MYYHSYYVLSSVVFFHGGGGVVREGGEVYTYSKEGQKSFPETLGPEIVMEEEPERHFFITLLVYYTVYCAQLL